MGKQLEDLKYSFFALPEIKPQGWLKNQLRIQADGLGGKIDRFWPDIRDSRWIGGTADGWERVPYWLDGFIPLAFLLDDEGMKERARQYVDGILARQQDDGWICPESGGGRVHYDMWAFFLVMKALIGWHNATGDERVEGAVRRALKSLDEHIDRWTLFGWAQTRWFEGLIAIYWLYDRAPEQWLLDLAVKIRAQGFDWVAFYEDWPMAEPLEYGRWSQMNHVVNQAMMLKSGPLYARLSGQPRDKQAIHAMLEQLDHWHGTAAGLFTGDECLAGTSPAQGTELCAVVEAMYSFEWLLALTGEARFGDRLERVAFNMLPAAFSADMEVHQYVQQANQPECSWQEHPVFLTNGPDANLYGVEPHCGCCAANMHQGWPKLAASAVMLSPAGAAVMSLLPVEAETKINGTAVRITVESEYPFRGSARVTVKAASPIAFTLSVRIPAWAAGAKVLLDGKPVSAAPGSFAEIGCEWDDNAVEIELPMAITAERRPNGLHTLSRGPLVYSLPIEGRWVRQDKPEGKEMPWLNNYEVFPTEEWRYGLALDPANPQRDAQIEEHAVGDCPFSPGGAPVSITVPARSVPWRMENGTALPTPDGKMEGPVRQVRLIPYGCTDLRMTEMPWEAGR